MTAPAGWHIYRGTMAPHDGIERLASPPPWRRFSGPVLPQAPLVESPNGTDPGARYLPEREAVELTNVALMMRRPLLVTGKPGTGKSTLAHSIAYELKLGPVLHWPITTRSRLAEALYQYDPIARLQQANLARLDESAVPSVGEFIRLGPLGTALLGRERPRVLLVDELDKSDIDLPNDMLNVLETGTFEIPELIREADTGDVRVQTADPGGWATVRHGQVRCAAFPMIVITSNGEREFPPAFLRRCVRVHIQQPSSEKLSQIITGQLGESALGAAGDVVSDFVALRETMDLSTDQLLNAVYFATSGLEIDGETRMKTVRRIFRDLGPGAEV
ncbi:ATPase AAA [Actinoplanes sp. OR16]|uniref:AAA family ATPase n=1 Tax=Actinoplanes sp. OR16 TaxID=946334 RepID=UPI000F6B4361|nr:MoxR family ATPase [Actinoplanes sp. OR16]BBH68348.1 ATPase AAA [Actinoplanes sp. OR16]